MHIRGLAVSVGVASCLLAVACGDDGGGGDDDSGGAGTSGSSGGGAGAGGRSGAGGNGGAAGGSAGSGGGASGAGGSAGSAGSAAGSGGASGGGGSAGSDEEDAGMDPQDSGQGSDDPTAVATVAGFNGGTVTGTWTFTQDGADVTVVIALENCPDGAHEVHIHEGMGCATEGEQGMHWGPTRGEGIPNVQCTGGEGTVTHTRAGTPTNLAWSIGGDESSDVVGHAVVVHATGSTARIGCGVIEAQ